MNSLPVLFLAGTLLVNVGPHASSAHAAITQAQDGRKIALIVNVSEFGTPPKNPNTGEQLRGYKYLPTVNDGALIRDALRAQGFLDEDVHMLRDAEADAAGIRRGFRWLLGEVGTGDVVVFHFSGHGHQIANDNADVDEEIDGLDEVLVPYGAPSEFFEGYDGRMHIRDDEVGALLADLRARVGSAGSVTFFVDACYSGTISRGDEWVRGYPTPMGGDGRPGAREVGTGIDMVAGATTRGPGDLAPYAVFSAASQWQMAYGVALGDEGPPVGLMTFALAKAISQAGPGTTHAALLARVTQTVSARKPQDPQLDGMANAYLFSNRLVAQAPYVTVDSVSPDGVTVWLNAGSVVGVNPGTRLLVHDVGTVSPDPGTAMATLEVTRSYPVQSVATIRRGVGASVQGAWAFITERSFGELALRVKFDESLTTADVEALTAIVDEIGIVERVEEGADLLIERRDGQIQALEIPGERLVGQGAQQIVFERLRQYARAQYVRRVNFESEDLDVTLDVSPASCPDDQGCVTPDWDSAESAPEHMGGGQWRFGPSAIYALRIRNTGPRRAYLAVLSLTDSIQVIRPIGENTQEELLPGDTLTIFLRAEAVPGRDELKVFATRNPQPFAAMFSAERSRTVRGGITQLEGVLMGRRRRTRSGGVDGTAMTRSVQIYVSGMGPGG